MALGLGVLEAEAERVQEKIMPKIKDKRREEFCQQYVVDFNGARAARDSGFSKKGARVQASYLLADLNISKRVAELMKNRSERTKITQDMVLQELAILGFSDFNDYGKVNKSGSVEFYPFKGAKKQKTRAIKGLKEVSGANGRSISLTLHGKEKSLELIGKHLGMFTEAHTLDVTGKVAFEVISAVPRPKKKKEEKK